MYVIHQYTEFVQNSCVDRQPMESSWLETRAETDMLSDGYKNMSVEASRGDVVR